MTNECPKCKTNNPNESKFCMECATPIPTAEEISDSHTKTLQVPIQDLSSHEVFADRYQIIEELGRGGMGVVHKAHDTKLKRMVALKFLPSELTHIPEIKERFMREAQAAAALDHPHICTVHEFDEADDKTFISMAYVEGQSLKKKIESGPIELDEALRIATQVAEGLQEAHEKGVVHRDIKSSNIMVTGKGQAKIMDFGLAKVAGEALLTKEGTTLGTVAYMSPEQARGEEVDHRSDIWSLGVVLYEMFSGKLPFMGDREASILYSVVNEEPKSLKVLKPDIPSELHQIINRALKKKPESRYQAATEMLKDLKGYQNSLRTTQAGAFNLRSFLLFIRRPVVAIPAVIIIVAIVIAASWFFNRQAKIRWARQELIPMIEQLVGEYFFDNTEAFQLAEQAEKYIPMDSKLKELFSKCSANISIKTEPPGAKIYSKDYKAPESEWDFIGVSPLENIRMPTGYFRWKIEKEDYETVYAATSTFSLDFSKKDLFIPNDMMRVLDKNEDIPPKMVRVSSTELEIGNFGDFFIDKYEVTNKQYKEFVESSGYRDQKYWKHEFIKDSNVLTWEEAMTEFVDRTSRTGPANWEAGDYPEGQDDYPVTGISWYEAAAYAEFVGKSLPTGYHWSIAKGSYTPMIRSKGFSTVLVPQSNFKGKGPAQVGIHQGITSYGAYDMAGNVREWCWNETSKGRLIRGGAWNDVTYMFGNWSQAPSFDRSPKNGFRCILYIDPDNIPEVAFKPKIVREERNIYQEKPVPDSIFQVYKEQFSYDKTDLNARVEGRNESAKDWIQEKITFDAAYGDERIIAYLFLPKNSPPPYQTIIYFPGSGSVYQRSSKDIEKYFEFENNFPFIIKDGRAILYPIYKGTFERSDDALTPIHTGANSHLFTEYLIQLGKDFKRCIDYLETRHDIDSKNIAYFGMSWGGVLGAIIPAVEERLKASILMVGGMLGGTRPEANQINYVTRIKIPTLMLNGKYDMTLAYETKVKPMFDLLGTPNEHKELKLYDTDHFIPKTEMIKEILAWLDRYLGPVK